MDCLLDRLGAVIKDARLKAGMTQEVLAKKLGVSARHIINIEKYSKKPSYSLLFRLIRELSIPTDKIFYPEHVNDRHDLECVITMLYRCTKKELCIVTSTLIALLVDRNT